MTVAPAKASSPIKERPKAYNKMGKVFKTRALSGLLMIS